MKVSTKGQYALRFMVDLALSDSAELVPLKNIAARQGITVKYLEQIIPLLSKAGLVLSARGSGGGYRLAKPANRYTAGEILRITEGGLSPVSSGDSSRTSKYSGARATATLWSGLEGAINEYLDSVTLEDLAAEEKRSLGSEYSI